MLQSMVELSKLLTNCVKEMSVHQPLALKIELLEVASTSTTKFYETIKKKQILLALPFFFENGNFGNFTRLLLRKTVMTVFQKGRPVKFNFSKENRDL